MISLHVFFWFMVILFGIIGSMRGWAKELLVFFSAVLGLFVITVLNRFGGFFTNIVTGSKLSGEFWLAISILSAPGILWLSGTKSSKTGSNQ